MNKGKLGFRHCADGAESYVELEDRTLTRKAEDMDNVLLAAQQAGFLSFDETDDLMNGFVPVTEWQKIIETTQSQLENAGYAVLGFVEDKSETKSLLQDVISLISSSPDPAS